MPSKTNRLRTSRKTRLKTRLIGKKIKSDKLSIADSSTDFFEDIPLYRGDKTRRLGKIHLSRSRRSKSTKS